MVQVVVIVNREMGEGVSAKRDLPKIQRMYTLIATILDNSWVGVSQRNVFESAIAQSLLTAFDRYLSTPSGYWHEVCVILMDRLVVCFDGCAMTAGVLLSKQKFKCNLTQLVSCQIAGDLVSTNIANQMRNSLLNWLLKLVMKLQMKGFEHETGQLIQQWPFNAIYTSFHHTYTYILATRSPSSERC